MHNDSQALSINNYKESILHIPQLHREGITRLISHISKDVFTIQTSILSTTKPIINQELVGNLRKYDIDTFKTKSQRLSVNSQSTICMRIRQNKDYRNNSMRINIEKGMKTKKA